MIVAAYAPIVGDLNLQRETPLELDRAFERYGVRSSQVREKCRRFLLAALREAGETVSETLLGRGAGRLPGRLAARALSSTGRRPQRSIAPLSSDEDDASPPTATRDDPTGATGVRQSAKTTIAAFRGLRLTAPKGFRLSRIERDFLGSLLDDLTDSAKPRRRRR